MLRYHERSRELVDLPPGASADCTVALLRSEEAAGIRFPESVREWYSLDGAVDLLHHHSNADRPIPLDRLGAPFEDWCRGGRRDFIRESLLLFMTENQGVCHWAVRLDGTEDPPVVVSVDSSPNEQWVECADRFSTFIHCQLWDWSPPLTACGAQDGPLDETTVQFLSRSFRAGPVTHGWPGSTNRRYDTAWGRILIWSTEWGADWHLRPTTADHLPPLLDSVWACATLATSLYGLTPEAERVVEARRHGPKTKGRVRTP